MPQISVENAVLERPRVALCHPSLEHVEECLWATAATDRVVDVLVGSTDQIPQRADCLLLHGLGRIIEKVPDG